jgi:gamma-glutamyltranspeptidase/glutathione hydrolase
VLRALGEGGKDAFYKGAPGRAIAAAVAAEGGLLSEADLAAHTSDFDTALSVEYHGVELWECPPAGQGITALVRAARPPGCRAGRRSALYVL